MLQADKNTIAKKIISVATSSKDLNKSTVVKIYYMHKPYYVIYKIKARFKSI